MTSLTYLVADVACIQLLLLSLLLLTTNAQGARFRGIYMHKYTNAQTDVPVPRTADYCLEQQFVAVSRTITDITSCPRHSTWTQGLPMTKTMGLCKSCRSIQADELPAELPWSSSSLEEWKNIPTTIFQPSLDALAVSANSCSLCELVLKCSGSFTKPIHNTMLYITRSADFGEGFQIHAESALSSRDGLGEFDVITVIDISVHDDSPLSSIFSGRPIQQPNRRDAVLRRASAWLLNCTEHPDCHSEKPLLPTRVLDIGTDTTSDQIVLEVTCNKRAQYVALSHRWGTARIPTTTKATLRERTTTIWLTSLPATFQDAVAVTRSLGFQYLWIDSLCIVQDDARDWEIESSKMAAVYSLASLTIAARGAKNASFGFFDTPSTDYIRFPYQSKTGVQDDLLLSLRPKRFWDYDHSWYSLEDDPLSLRGWAFQERLLSPRMLHFREDGMVFECSNGSRSERGYFCPDQYLSAMSFKRDLIVDDERVLMKFWSRIVQYYSRCGLTKFSDVLPALSGVVDMFAELSGDKYVAGLWLSHIVSMHGLMWRYELDQSVSQKEAGEPDPFLRQKEAEYKGPSWSWSCSPCMVRVHPPLSETEAVASLADYVVVPKGANPYGEVKSAYLKLSAPLIKATLMSPPSLNTVYLPQHAHPAEGSTSFIRWDEARYSNFDEIFQGYSNLTLFALALSTPRRTARGAGTINGLIVALCETHTLVQDHTSDVTAWRLGMFRFDGGLEEISPQLKNRVLVTLV